MLVNDIREKLTHSGLRVTPQRVAVMDAIHHLHHHPTTDHIIQYIKEHYPHIATGTVYKILDIFVDHGLVRRVKTDDGIMRYDTIMEKHHHLYCAESDRIEDYFDEELNHVLEDYFDRHRIQGFKIEDMKLQIIGKFEKQKNNSIKS